MKTKYYDKNEILAWKLKTDAGVALCGDLAVTLAFLLAKLPPTVVLWKKSQHTPADSS